MNSSIQRKRLACVECTRRKIKCDKVLPCRNCTRRDIVCSRPRDHQIPRSTPRLSSVPRPTVDAPSTDVVRLVENLQARVDQLEIALQEVNTLRGTPPVTEIPIDEDTETPSRIQSQDPDGTRATAIVEQDKSEIEDAATILEFLAWGRRKDPKYHDLIARKERLVHPSPGDIPAADDTQSFSGSSPLFYLQTLLPSRSQMFAIARYHCECLLWYHGSFHSPAFLQDLECFYDKFNGQIDGSDVDLQWLAFLFSIITGSMTCAPHETALSWGFGEWEQETLSKKWFKAATTCLHHADYTAWHSIYAVQAVATLTISAHMLGFSNSQSVMLASAVRIAQSLGLHRLGEEKGETSTPDLIDRETGRRVWCQLCIQDWFSIPFSESYLIHQRCFDTGKPRNCSEDDMRSLPEGHPTLTNYSRFFYDIAMLMPQLQDATVSSNTLYTKYEKVLEYDRQLRALATTHLPYYLQNVPLDPSWPCYVPWARRSLAISSSHKIIMIHRKFLGVSFTNPVFSRTRRTCVAAARTIVKEQKAAIDDGGPVLWIHHAFCVAASIILCLDMFHRPVTDPECYEHRQLVQDGIGILSRSDTNMIAKRGVPLLEALLSNEKRKRSSFDSLQGPDRTESPADDTSSLGLEHLDIPGVIRRFCEQHRLKFTGPKSREGRSVSLSLDELQQDWPPTQLGGDRNGAIRPSTGPFATYDFEDSEILADVLALASDYVT